MKKTKLSIAIGLIKNGDKAKALPILADVIHQNPDDEEAWIWLYLCVDEKKKKIDCLQRIIKINPNNVSARSALQKLLNGESISPTPIDNSSDKDPEKPDFQGTLHHSKGEYSTVNTSSTGGKRLTSIKVYGKVLQLKSIRMKEVSGSTRFTSVLKSNIRGKPKGKRKEIKVIYKPPTRMTGWKEENNSEDFSEINTAAQVENGLYGNSLVIDGVYFRSSNRPKCLQVDCDNEEDICQWCEFFYPETCLLNIDPQFADDLMALERFRLANQAIYQQRSIEIAQTIYDELKAHGRPLHYSVIIRMISNRYPNLHLKNGEIYQQLIQYREFFERVSLGVYRAK